MSIVHPPQYVTCHISHVTCHVSRVMCHMSHVAFFFILFLFFWIKCWNLLVERLLSMGPTPSSFTKNDLIDVLMVTALVEQPLALLILISLISWANANLNAVFILPFTSISEILRAIMYFYSCYLLFKKKTIELEKLTEIESTNQT